VADAFVAREVSSHLREVDTSKEVAVAQEGAQEGADARIFTRERERERESPERCLRKHKRLTLIEVAAAQGVREGGDSARGRARGSALSLETERERERNRASLHFFVEFIKFYIRLLWGYCVVGRQYGMFGAVLGPEGRIQ
jgi:hypothetical protein